MSWGLTGGTSVDFVATLRREASGWTPNDDEWEHNGHPSGFSAHVFPHGDNSYHHWLVYSPSGKNVARGKAGSPDEAMGAAEQTMNDPPRPYRYGPDDLEFGQYQPQGPTAGAGAAGVWAKGDNHGPENWLSGITWGPDGTIGHVETKPDHQRNGLATQLFDYVKQNHRPDLQHSTTLTDDGKAWSQHEQGRIAAYQSPDHVPALEDLWNDYQDWHNTVIGPGEDYRPHHSVQSWGNVEGYLEDRHGLSPHDPAALDHPVAFGMAKLHSLAQSRPQVDGHDYMLSDDDLTAGAALGLLKIRKNDRTKRLEPAWNPLDHFSFRTSASYPYTRNNNGVRVHSPQGYGQDVEPWGRYMNPGHGPDELAPGWERGHVDFDNPLHIDEDGWKHNLSQQYGGATGQALSDALIADGYDGIMTGHPKYGPGEMVDIRPRDQRRHRTASVVHLPTDEVLGYFRSDNEWRTKQHPKKWEQLYHSIKNNGVQEPIDIEHNDTHAVIGDGHHRAEIAHLLGHPTVPVNLTPDPYMDTEYYADNVMGNGLKQHLQGRTAMVHNTCPGCGEDVYFDEQDGWRNDNGLTCDGGGTHGHHQDPPRGYKGFTPD